MNRLIDKIWLLFCILITFTPVILSITLAITYSNWAYLLLILLVIVSAPIAVIVMLLRVSSELNHTVQLTEKE